MSSKFQERLRAARELRNLSQSELAENAGFQASAISHFETGGRSPSFDNLKKLANALNVTTDYLLGRTEDATTCGPVGDKLFRHADKVSAQDLELLAQMAETFAKRNEQAHKKEKK
jgi:transcriptional regulator with XRE-family HTH domain